MATTIDTLQVEITAITKDFNRQIDGIKGKLNELGAATDQASTRMMAGFDSVGAIATKALKVGVVGAIAAVAASIPGAVKRIDTLNNAPKILLNLGYAAEDSGAAMKKLDLGIRGLPTSLDEATSSLIAIASASGRGISEATDLTLAFNNMALAGGKGPAEAQRAFVQFTQAIGRGKMGMQEFNTLAEVMPAQLTQVAQGLIGPSANMATLRDALSEGTITMDQFMNEIVRLNTNGGANFASFSIQAKDATAGIATGFANMRISITRGIAAIIAAIGASNITEALGTIGRAFGTVLLGVAGLIEFIAAHSDIFGPMAVGIAAATAAILAYNTYVRISTVVTLAWTAASTYLALVASLQAQGLGLLRAAWMALNIMMAANPIGIVIMAVVAITAALIYFFTQTETGRKVFQVAMNAIQSAIQFVWNWIKGNWPLLLAILTGPIGIAVGIIIRNADQIRAALTNAWNAIRGVWSAASGFFSSVGGGIVGAVSGIPGAFASIFRSAWNQVTSIFSALPGWFRGLDLTGAGRALIQSLINGIKSMAGAAQNAAKQVVSSIRDFFPFSPAKKGPFSGKGYTTHSGKALMRDFADAVKKQEPYLQKTMANVMPEMSVPELNQLQGGINISHQIGDIDERSNHIVVKIGEDTLIDRVVRGINRQSFMGNATIIEL